MLAQPRRRTRRSITSAPRSRSNGSWMAHASRSTRAAMSACSRATCGRRWRFRSGGGRATAGRARCDLDGEVIALGPEGTPHPFQTTMQRLAALDVDACEASSHHSLRLPLCRWREPDRYGAETRAARLAIIASLAVPSLVRPTRKRGAARRDAASRTRRFMVKALAPLPPAVVATVVEGQERAHARPRSSPPGGHGRRTGWLSNLHL
jgi:hypothetical protein